MYKKVISVAMVLIVVLVGVYFTFGKEKVNSKINENILLSISNSTDVKSSVFNSPNGEIVGTLKKEKIDNFVIKFFQKSLANDKDLLLETVNDYKHKGGFPYDVDYKMKYTIQNEGLTAKVDGDVEILTFDLINTFNKIFKTAKPLKFSISSDSKTTNSVFEISGIDMINNNDIIKTSPVKVSFLLTDNDTKIKNFSLLVPNFHGFYKDNQESIDINIADLFVSMDYDNTINLDSDFYSFYVSNNNQKSSIKNISVTFNDGSDKVDLFLENLFSDASTKLDGDFITSNGLAGVDNISFSVLSGGENMKLNFKKLSSQANLKIDQGLLKFIEQITSDTTFDEITKNFGKGVTYEEKELSIQNSDGEKLSLSFLVDIPKISNASNNDFSMLDTTKFKANINSTSNFAKFLSQDPNLAMLGAMIDQGAAQFLKQDQNNGLSASIELKNKDIYLNNSSFKELFGIDLFENLSNVSNGTQGYQKEDAELAKTIANLNTFVSDVSAYYTAMGKLSPELYNMTNVPFDIVQPNKGYLKTANKKCILILLNNDKFFIEKGLDDQDPFCQKLYSEGIIVDYFNKSPIIFK